MDWLIRFPQDHRILFALVLLLLVFGGSQLFWRGKRKRTSRPSLGEALKRIMVGKPIRRTAGPAARIRC
jgi:hypothetical protein